VDSGVALLGKTAHGGLAMALLQIIGFWSDHEKVLSEKFLRNF
jgi:hypothetical protein